MVSTRNKRKSNGRLLSQLHDFDQDNITGNAMSDRQENTTFNESTADQDFTVGNSDSNPAVIETVVKVKTSERCLNERVDRKMGKTGFIRQFRPR